MVPFFLDFARPILSTLAKNKTASVQQMMNNAIVDLQLTEEDCAEMIRSQRKTQVSDRTSWAVTYLFQAGLIERVSRGEYRITEEGRKVYLSGEKITKDFLRNYNSFVDFQQRRNEPTPTATDSHQHNIVFTETTPSEAIEEAVNEINSSLASEILELVKKQSPRFFEQLVVDLLMKMGYGQNGFTEVTRYSKDEGIDGIIAEDKLGLNKVYLQAKRWDNGTVGRKDVTSFIGTLTSKSSKKGVFITTSTFSKEAYDSLNHLPSDVSVVLIDGITLANYMVEFNLGVTIKKTYEVKRIDSDYFEENI
ncbi:MAG: restriction endonuclease [Bacteroidales bacterium]|nr:restriction endonuclease [Bacteroidales bacterium]